jgi:hypothetical protein
MAAGQIDIAIPPEIEQSAAVRIVEACLAAEKLIIVRKGTLKKYPGCIHWHVKRGSQRGTLELTLWQSRLWSKVNAGRTGDWIEATVANFLKGLDQALSNR